MLYVPAADRSNRSFRAGTPRILASGSLLRYADVIDSRRQRARIVAHSHLHRPARPFESQVTVFTPDRQASCSEALHGFPPEPTGSGPHDCRGSRRSRSVLERRRTRTREGGPARAASPRGRGEREAGRRRSPSKGDGPVTLRIVPAVRYQPVVVAPDVDSAVRRRGIAEEPVRREEIVCTRRNAIAQREDEARRVAEGIAEPAVGDLRLVGPGAVEWNVSPNRNMPFWAAPISARFQTANRPATAKTAASAWRRTMAAAVLDERSEAETKQRDDAVEAPPAESVAAPPVLDTALKYVITNAATRTGRPTAGRAIANAMRPIAAA